MGDLAGLHGTAVALAGSMSVTTWLHTEGGVLHLVAAAASTVIPFAIWLAVSRRLPSRGTHWRGRGPGALLVALGIQAFTLFTIWFLAPRLGSSTELYGPVGIVGTLLFWLYVLGRLVIPADTLNAFLHEHRTATAAQGHSSVPG